MGTQHKLSDDQLNILDRIWDKRIDIENGCYDLDDLYADALEEWDMQDSDVDNCIDTLREFGYLDKQDNLTSAGKQYLEIGYVPESVVINNITNTNIENQKIINSDKYVERNAPVVEVGSIIKGEGISVKNEESVGAGLVKGYIKDLVQKAINILRK